jgi:hypothetical protein
MYTTMSMNLKSSSDIENMDVIVLKFPLFWTFQTPVTINDVTANYMFREFWSISNIEQECHMIYIRFNLPGAGIPKNTNIPLTITLKSPQSILAGPYAIHQ